MIYHAGGFVVLLSRHGWWFQGPRCPVIKVITKPLTSDGYPSSSPWTKIRLNIKNNAPNTTGLHGLKSPHARIWKSNEVIIQKELFTRPLRIHLRWNDLGCFTIGIYVWGDTKSWSMSSDNKHEGCPSFIHKVGNRSSRNFRGDF